MAKYQIDDAFLDEIGFESKDKDLRAAEISSLQSKFEMMVGVFISDRFTEEELDEFEDLLDSKADEETQLNWLDKHYPDYSDVVDKMYKQMKDELKK